MGASSSGLLDEAKASHIKGLVDSSFQNFSVFYRQQYPAAYFGHLQQEVEPKKQERGLLLTQRPRPDPGDVLFEGRARFSTWDDQSRKGKEKYVVLKKNYCLEIHESQESFLRGTAAKLVLQPIGGTALTSEDEAQTLLDQTCSEVLNGLKEDSPSAGSTPEGFAVHLHLPHIALYRFLFQNESEQHHFLSSLQSCIRHHDLDPWSDASYESQAFIHALRLYRQDKGCYECWEILLGPEEQVLAAQFMEEVLPWLHSQLQNKVKGKKTERIRLWLATVHAAYRVVLEQLKPALEALRAESGESASANQGLVRANLDQISASQSFLLDKIQGCVKEEAECVCSEFISPYMPSVLEALTENIGSALKEMRQTLQAQIDSALAEGGEGSQVTKKVSLLTTSGLEKCYQQVERLKQDLSGLRERFEMNSTERLVLCAHLDMEKLLKSAIYTFELFLRTSSRLQPNQYSQKTNRAKERVLKQLDYDSRLVQKRLYEEALLQITLPNLTRRLDSSWRNELQQFEQYIFSDFSNFILVQNLYQDVLRNILTQEIQKVLQEAMSKTSSNLLLDTSDLAISQYSLLGQTVIPPTHNSPALQACEIPATIPKLAPTLDNNPTVELGKEIVPPVIVVTPEINEIPSDPVMDLLRYESSDSESVKIWEENSDSDPLEVLESLTSLDDQDEVLKNNLPEIKTNSELEDLEKLPDDSDGSPSLRTMESPNSQEELPMKMSLETLSEAIVCDATEKLQQQSTDKAVYIKGSLMENWKSEKEEKINNDHSPPVDSAMESKTEQEVNEGVDAPDMDKNYENLDKEEMPEDVNNNTNTEEGLVSSQPIEMQEENCAAQPVDSVAAIRDLVIEVTEVEMMLSPCPDNTE
ncbi:protein Niban 1-like isoform X2 [Periophthalmus magnuspinnatus]|uniref:protein Niban 1-like isoform X2 n=1 Tax=Periophthalmus magnuspinnatus TaxID=409849 RepID=UPI00145BEF9A|nr:protein Niban 1-like isoform X2 [Periophthalmus magnuspinnatus]